MLVYITSHRATNGHCTICSVNFKKNERNYNAENSEVFKMVQEADKEPRSPEPGEYYIIRKKKVVIY